LIVSPLAAEQLPADAEALALATAARLPRVHLPALLIEVDRVTGGTVALTVTLSERRGCRHEYPPPTPCPGRRSAFAGSPVPPRSSSSPSAGTCAMACRIATEELMVGRGVQVDHVTIYRWVLRFTPLLADAARPSRHAVGDRWQIDETYVKVAGKWRYVDRAIDQFGK